MSAMKLAKPNDIWIDSSRKPKVWLPHNYQLTALSFLLSSRQSGLLLDPGLGKTSISLQAIKILRAITESTGVLMIAPLRVVYSVWPDEIEKWANFNGLTYTILHDDTAGTLWGPKKDIYLINPEGLDWLQGALLRGLTAGKKSPFNTLWIDESSKFKNYDAARFKLLVSMLPLFSRRHIMTGTPAPKSLLDLWAQAYLLDEGKTLGHNYNDFRMTHFAANDWNKYQWDIRDGAEKAIHGKVAPLVLEMSAADHLSMPPLTYNDIRVSLPFKALKHYKRMEREYLVELDDGIASADAAAQASGKCHQIANGCVYEDIPEDLTEEEEKDFRRTRKTLFVHDAKIEALQELIDELNGKPLLIAYHFKHDLVAIKKLLGKDMVHIGSGISARKSKKIVDKWNAGKIKFLVGHPSSMGYGLNMQESGNDICWFSLTWNLEEYMQFIRRIWRQGVVGAVRVHHLIASNTIDLAMLMRLGERAKTQEDLRKALKWYRSELNKQAA